MVLAGGCVVVESARVYGEGFINVPVCAVGTFRVYGLRSL